MPRAGRSLEEFVREIERLLANSPVEIRSPDFVMGQYSRSRREIDVSLRAKDDPDRILLMIECRDRQDVQDVAWIDGIIGKRDDVGAERAVVVSPSGFSAGARNMARVRGIDLRTFEEVDPSTLADWLTIRSVSARSYNLRYNGVPRLILDLDPPLGRGVEDYIVLQRLPLTWNTPVLTRKRDGSAASLNDVWIEAPKLGLLDHLAPGEERQGTLVLTYRDPEGFTIDLDRRAVDVKEIHISGKFSYLDEELPMERYYWYQDEAGVLTQNSEASFEYKGALLKIGVHRSADESRIAVISRRSGERSERFNYVQAIVTVSPDTAPTSSPSATT